MASVCRLFAAGKKCKYGADCKFPHERTSSNNAPQRTHVSREAPRGQNHHQHDTEETLKKWRFNIPPDARAIKKARPINIGLFIQQALQLVNTGSDEMQTVIGTLATEGGLFRLTQFYGYDYDGMADARLATTWRSQLLPYLRVLSHEAVVASAVVSREYAVLLHNLYGFDGQQCVKIFRTAVRCLSIDGTNRQEEVEVAVTALACVLEKVGSAQINTELQAIAEALIALVDGVYSRAIERALRSVRTTLKLEADMPTLSNHTTDRPVTSLPTFTVAQDLPGDLSADGPRHSNDSADIADIQILPTREEIQSSRLEYLPHDDPNEWHLSGIAGLVDRHFRLVREDTVGQLRDAAKCELERLLDPSSVSSSQGARTHTYFNVDLQDVVFDPRKGLLFVLSFDQPEILKNKTTIKQRKDWWDDSMRLTPDSLVCLLSSDGHAKFLVVHSPMRPIASTKTPEQKAVHERYSTSKDPIRAFVVFELAELNDGAVTDFLQACTSASANSRRSLIEFPGVVLPAFAPTLGALQHMADNLDVPFADVLSPGAAPATQAPAYSQKPGFVYGLRKLLSDTHNEPARTGDRDTDIANALQASALDDAQQRAVHHTLNHAFSLIQGPPGTGKSYTGVKLIQALLENRLSAKLGPIICVCFTNHALDQLLEHLLDAGVEQVIRVGNRSKSERLAAVNLRIVASKQELTKTEKERRWRLHKSMESTTKQVEDLLARLNVALSDPDRAIEAYLRDNLPTIHNQLFTEVDEDGFEFVRGRNSRSPLQDWLSKGHTTALVRPQDLTTLQSGHIPPHTMPYGERQALYAAWLNSITDDIYNDLEVEISSWIEDKEATDSIRGEVDLRVLSSASVIGITTTGLARSIKHLRKLTSKVLVVEEAGEVLEAHLLTAMLPSLEHVILIGDHFQLRPKIQNYDLSVENPRTQTALDVSLFERLVKPHGDRTDGGVPFVTLETQRRMHPSISQLVRSTLYPKLQDSPSVMDLPEVVGMRQRLYWLEHDKKEDGKNAHIHSTSHTNTYEVDMVTALVRHLVRQGIYSSRDIAVLTPYLGQLRKLRHKLGSLFDVILSDRDVEELILDGLSEDGDHDQEDPNTTDRRPLVAKGNLLQALRLATVDNFQGEEAKVVIISLVRCNDQRKCGFLRTSNRINVLLTRAQHGMYIIGNASTSEHVPMWRDVLAILKSGGNFGPCLELCCPRHPEKAMHVAMPEDFNRVSPEAGCDLLCGKQLPCGHACPNLCHPIGIHNNTYCLKDCNRPKQGCQHPCKLPCGEPCEPKCTEVLSGIDVQLECGHRFTSLECWQYQHKERIRCEEPVERVVPSCGHTATVACYIDVNDPSFQCQETCGAILECGHLCTKVCCSCRQRKGNSGKEMDHGKCTRNCGRNYTTCEHACVSLCHTSEACPPCAATCGVGCAHSTCSKHCHEPCVPCAEEQCSSRCPHSACRMPCAAPCDWIPCSKRCQKKLSCGHKCPSLCGEICPSTKYCQICATVLVKEMRVDFITFETYEEVDLNETPCIFLPCGHIFTVDTMDGQMEMSQYYQLDGQGHPKSLKGSAEAFSVERLKSCPDCRASLRSVSRYGRIVRRSLLDINTKKFITWSNGRCIELATMLQTCQDQLLNSASKAMLSGTMKLNGTIIKSALKAAGSRYKTVLKLLSDLVKFHTRVRKEEQPYQKVRDLVEAVRRRQHPGATIGEFELDNNIVQTRAQLLAQALLIRCHLVIYTDVMAIWEAMSAKDRTNLTLLVEFSSHRMECDNLLDSASNSLNRLQEAEANIFWAQLAALECSAPYSQPGNSMERVQDMEALKRQGEDKLCRAQEVCDAFPAQTASVVQEIEGVRRMLSTSISGSEMRMVVGAMATEFTGTGHWYRCINGHPFTIGECGMPMQTARCPQCNAAIGGQNHQAVEGVTHARDLEEDFGGMHI